MQIEVKEIEPCKLIVSYTADAEQILNKRGEVIDAFKKAPVPGFRPGKAGVDAIRMHYRTQIEESLKRALAEDAYHNTLFEKKLRPHGAPRFNSALLADGKFTCEFELFTKPDFEVFSYKGMEIPKPAETVNPTELSEKMMQELRVKFGEATPYSDSDFIQNGDNVILDYDGFVDGEKSDSLSAEGEMLTVGNSQLQEFDNNLLGMSLGETREFNLLVPENGLPSIANKTIRFKVTLNMGSKTVPCPLNDELAIKLGKKDFAELKEFVFGTAVAKAQATSKQALIDAICTKLVDVNVVSVPNWLSLSEAQYLAHNSKLEWDKMLDEDKEKYLEMSTKNVKLSLILDKIREDEPDAQLTDQEVFEVIKRNLATTKLKTPLDEIIKEMDRTGYLQIMFSRIRDEHALDFVLKSTTFVE